MTRSHALTPPEPDQIRLHCIGLGHQFSTGLLSSILTLVQRGIVSDTVHICDTDPQRLASAQRTIAKAAAAVDPSGQLGARVSPALVKHHDIEALLAAVPGPSARRSPGIPVAAVSTWPETHFELATACLDHGMHVYVDKPPTLSQDRTARLVEQADARGLTLVVGAQRRMESIYVRSLDRIRTIGRLTRIHAHHHGTFKGGADPAHRESNVAVGIGYHTVDTVVWVLEELGLDPRRLRVVGSTARPWDENPASIRFMEALLVYEGDSERVPVSIGFSSLSLGGTVDETLLVCGTEGEVRLQRVQAPRTRAPGSATHSYYSTGPSGRRDVVSEPLNDPSDTADRGAPLRQMILGLARRERRTIRSTGRQSLATARILDDMTRRAYQVAGTPGR